jgi:hypothetical protein
MTVIGVSLVAGGGYSIMYSSMAQLSDSSRSMVDRTSIRGSEFRPNPTFWSLLAPDDKIEFLRLRSHFHSSQSALTKDSRSISFRNDLTQVLQFIERDESNREVRSILTGIAFACLFICVNTRLLKSFLGRCKLSINSSFQQMGYAALKTKTKTRKCILTVMGNLSSDQTLLTHQKNQSSEFCELQPPSI